MTYEELIARIAAITHRSDLTPQMQDFVNASNEQINTRLHMDLIAPEPGVSNTLLEAQPLLYLYSALVSAYEFINEGDLAGHYQQRFTGQIDEYNITSVDATDEYVMGFTVS
jgi:hypothetical protein